MAAVAAKEAASAQLQAAKEQLQQQTLRESRTNVCPDLEHEAALEKRLQPELAHHSIHTLSTSMPCSHMPSKVAYETFQISHSLQAFSLCG